MSAILNFEPTLVLLGTILLRLVALVVMLYVLTLPIYVAVRTAEGLGALRRWRRLPRTG